MRHSSILNTGQISDTGRCEFASARSFLGFRSAFKRSGAGSVWEIQDAGEVLQPFWARLLKWIVAILSLPMAMKATAFCMAAWIWADVKILGAAVFWTLILFMMCRDSLLLTWRTTVAYCFLAVSFALELLLPFNLMLLFSTASISWPYVFTVVMQNDILAWPYSTWHP